MFNVKKTILVARNWDQWAKVVQRTSRRFKLPWTRTLCVIVIEKEIVKLGLQVIVIDMSVIVIVICAIRIQLLNYYLPLRLPSTKVRTKTCCCILFGFAYVFS